MSAPSTSPYKPSPLSLGSPRASPFRRPESPATVIASSTATAIRPTTPTTTQSTLASTPSKLQSGLTTAHTSIYTPEGSSRFSPTVNHGDFLTSPTRTGADRGSPALGTHSPQTARNTASSTAFSPSGQTGDMNLRSSSNTPRPYQNSSIRGLSASQGLDALTHLPPAQVREMREAFQILDRDGDGIVDRSDVTEALTGLGLPTSPASTHVSPYFTGKPSETLALPAFLGMLSGLLAPLSARTEMLAALAAFDDDDSGQVDVRELVEALAGESGQGSLGLSRAEAEEAMKGFIGKRSFGGGGGGMGMGLGRPEVFRYKEWVDTLSAVGGSAEAGSSPGETSRT